MYFEYCYLCSILVFGIGAERRCDKGLLIVMFYALLRLLYATQAPVVGVAIYSAYNKNNESVNRVDELERVANCMDEQTYFNSDLITSNLKEQKGKIVTCLGLWWVSIFASSMEALFFLCLLGKFFLSW